MNLFTFGDSHRSCFDWIETNVNMKYDMLNTLGIDNIKSSKESGNGAYTLSTFAVKGVQHLDIKRDPVQDGDIVIFCLGEIDCRSHFCKPEHFLSYKEIIDDIVPRYFEAIKKNVEQLNDLKVMVFNVVPPIRSEGIYFNASWPFAGTDEQRKEVVLYMNFRLRDYCEKYGYIFFDVYTKYCGADGFIDPALNDGNVHIQNPVYLMEFLHELKRKGKF